MKLVLTGSQSYIGTVLLPMLKEKHEVWIIDEKLGSDITHYATMDHCIKWADAIVHLAAVSTPALCEANPVLATRVNVDAVKMINDLRKDKPIFFPNTNIGYGVDVRQDVYDENSPMNPKSVYGQTKCEGERLILEAGNCVVFRLASLFGVSPGMRWNLLLNFMVKEAFEKKRLELYEPHVRRNFLHVKDMCSAFLYAIDHYDAMKNQVYNVGLRLHPTKMELAQMIVKHLNVPITEVEGADPDRRDYFISTEKLLATGWKPEVTFDDGIRELIACLAS